MERKIVLFAHNIRSLWNVGSFFRTADAFGVQRIILSGYTSVPPRREITKTALGAEEWIPWEKTAAPREALQKLKTEGYRIVALELTESSEKLHAFRSDDSICLVVGHEILGIPKELLDASDVILKIPMRGKKHSLNVSVATGVALYHLSCICPSGS